MAAWGREAGNDEIIGRLGGRICVDTKGTYVIVQDASLIRKAHGTPGTIVADCQAQEDGRVEFERRCRSLDSVGWWHTHPGNIGLFFSGTDRKNQATWTDANAIGIVMQPDLRGEMLKVFRGPDCSDLKLVNPEMCQRVARQGQATRQCKPLPKAECARQCACLSRTRLNEFEAVTQTTIPIPPAIGKILAIALPILLIVLLVQSAFLGVWLGRATATGGDLLRTQNMNTDVKLSQAGQAPAQRTHVESTSPEVSAGVNANAWASGGKNTAQIAAPPVSTVTRMPGETATSAPAALATRPH